MRYKVGDEIWIGDFNALAPCYETCPDCGGTGRLRVTFHDETQVSIECRNCCSGYDPPTGGVVVHRQAGTARKAVITGLEMDGEKIRWHVDGTEHGYRIVDDEHAFDTESDALLWAKQAAAVYEAEQRNRIAQKEKDTRSWAWNASYHRRCIARAEKDIEYHTKKLAVASIRAKETR